MRKWDRTSQIQKAGGQDTKTAIQWKNYHKKQIEEVIKESGVLKRDYSAEKGYIKNKFHNLSFTEKLKGENIRFSDYPIKNDKSSVREAIMFAKNNSKAELIDMHLIKNDEVLRPVLEELVKLEKEQKKGFVRIIAVEMDDFTIAEEDGYKLKLNTKFFNSKEATLAKLNYYEAINKIPKGCNNLKYIARHENGHLITDSLLDNNDSRKEIVEICSKNGYKCISERGYYNIYESIADLLAQDNKRLSESEKKTKKEILEIVKMKIEEENS